MMLLDALPVEELSSPADHWLLSPHLILRVCGLPAETLEALATPRTRAWYEAHARITESLEAQGSLLRARLEKLIEQESAERLALINLRRDVFNSRRPRAVVIERAQGALTTQDQDLLDTWQRTHEAAISLRKVGNCIVDEEIAANIPILQRVLDDGSLRSAVLLQSEDLELQMDRYLTADPPLDKAARRVERSLIELLTRAAGKTSPFSTLTSVAYGRFDSETSAVRPMLDEGARTSHIQANVAILSRLAQVILERRDLREHLSVALAPGASTVQDGLVRYVRRRRSSTEGGDGTVVLDSVHEEMFYLPSGPAMYDSLEIVPQVRTLGELAARLLVADSERAEDAVYELIGHLIRVSFLVVPSLQVDLHAADPLVAFIDALEHGDHPTLAAVAAKLRNLRECVNEYRSAEPRDRRAVLAKARAAVNAAFAEVAADPDQVPRVIVYEDVCHGADVVLLNELAVGEPLEASLAALAEILPAFDHRAPFREALVGFFLARYGKGGSCDDFQRFAHEFQRDFFDAFSKRMMRRTPTDDENRVVAQENWFNSPVIGGLDRARALASELLLDERSKQPGRVVHLGEKYLERVRGALHNREALRHPWSFLSQVVTRDTHGARFVLNQVYAGQTLMFSRFLNGLHEGGADAVANLRAHLRGSLGEGAVLAELRGGFDTTNLNLHPQLTDYEIVCPGDTSHRPDAEQIHLQHLRLEHEPATGRVILRDSRTGLRVIPVYLGFLMPLSLPEVQQVLLCLSPMGMGQIDLWAGTGEKVVIDSVTHYPRVQLGDLVIHREMWKMPRREFPLRQPAESRADYFLRIQEWREVHHIPRHIYARADFGGEVDAPLDEQGPDVGGGSAGRKPLGVDFDSWHLVALLEQLVLKSNNRIVLTEALPDQDDTWATDSVGRDFVSEVLLELYPERTV